MTNQSTSPIRLDVSGLLPPEPMERILDALAVLPHGVHLQVLIDREPVPLYRILERHGCRHHIAARGDGSFDLTIWAVQCRES